MNNIINGIHSEIRFCSEEIQYLDLINTILRDNNIEEGRNGKVYVSFGNISIPVFLWFNSSRDLGQ